MMIARFLFATTLSVPFGKNRNGYFIVLLRDSPFRSIQSKYKNDYCSRINIRNEFTETRNRANNIYGVSGLKGAAKGGERGWRTSARVPSPLDPTFFLCFLLNGKTKKKRKEESD